jgi:hypothetical protein
MMPFIYYKISAEHLLAAIKEPATTRESELELLHDLEEARSNLREALMKVA